MVDSNRQSMFPTIRRQNIWRNSQRKLVEHSPRLDVDIMRPACGAVSADVGWSFVWSFRVV